MHPTLADLGQLGVD